MLAAFRWLNAFYACDELSKTMVNGDKDGMVFIHCIPTLFPRYNGHKAGI